MYPQWQCYTYDFFVNKSVGYEQSAMRISSVLRRMMDFHVGDCSWIRGCDSAISQDCSVLAKLCEKEDSTNRP